MKLEDRSMGMSACVCEQFEVLFVVNAKLNELNKRAFCTLASIKQLMHVKYAKYEMES